MPHEIIIGCYEQHLLGFTYPELKPSFTSKQHNSPVRTLDINQESSMLASAGIDEQVYLINLKNRREYGALFGHSGSVNQVKFAENGSLYSASDDGLMIHWKNVKVPGSKKKSWEKMGQVSGKVKAVNSKAKIEDSKFVSIGIHPSSNLAILGNAGAKGLDIVDLSNEKVVASKRLRGKGKKQQLDVPNFVEFTPDGQKMVIFSEPATLRCKGIDGNDVWKVASELRNGFEMENV